MKLLQTVYEKINSWLGNDPYNSGWNQKKYDKFFKLIPEGEYTFGQFDVIVGSRYFDVYFKDVRLLDHEINFSSWSYDRTYLWIWSDGPFQQDFIDFIDEYIIRKTDEKKLKHKIKVDGAWAIMETYIPGKVIF